MSHAFEHANVSFDGAGCVFYGPHLAGKIRPYRAGRAGDHDAWIGETSDIFGWSKQGAAIKEAEAWFVKRFGSKK